MDVRVTRMSMGWVMCVCESEEREDGVGATIPTVHVASETRLFSINQ